jgi:hypothetical protein
MNFKLKMRFVIFAHVSPSIPHHGVVAISSLFHFGRKGKYRLLEQRQKFPTSENETKGNMRQHRGMGMGKNDKSHFRFEIHYIK